MDDKELRAALAAHRKEMTELYAGFSALESVLIGVLVSAKKRGMGTEFFEEVFDFAASTHIAAAAVNPGATQTTRALQIVDHLREAVVPHHGPTK